MRPTPDPRTDRRIPHLTLVIGLLLVLSGLLRSGVSRALEIDMLVTERDVDALSDASRLTIDNPELWHEGPTLVVSNTTMENNGECWRPDRCIADPGPDGISLAEAMQAVNGYNLDLNAHETITFDPSLDGAVITTTGTLEIIESGLTIDGDIDDDGVPDITLDGQGIKDVTGFAIRGVSHVIIDGVDFQNFGALVPGGAAGGAIGISNDLEKGVHHLENLVIRNCTFTNIAENAIGVGLQDHSFGSIRNLEITGNTFQGYWTGIALGAGGGTSASDNEIAHVKIISNTFTGDATVGAISIRGAGGPETTNSSRNLVDDVEIRGNTMTGHTNVTILIDAANRNSCNDNTISNLVIAENVIDGQADTIELVSVGESGTNSTGNLVTDVAIVDNLVTGGGIALSGAAASGAMSNTISSVLVERNRISDCEYNGVHVYAGDNGAAATVVERVIVRNNVIEHSGDAGILLDDRACALPGNKIDDVAITNNTVVSNGLGSGWGAGGLHVDKACPANIISGVTISNTVLWGNNLDDAIGGSVAGEVSVAHSILNDGRFLGSDGNVYADPQFAAPGSGDYRLQPGSPALESGDPSGAGVGPQDLDGRLRLWDYDGDESAVVDRGAHEYGSSETKEIEIQGSGIVIFDGDAVPVPWDGTDFGSAFVGRETVTRTFAIRNTGGATLTLTGAPKVAITGTHAADFSVTTAPASTISPGSETTFVVTFDPTGRGLRTATIRIDNDDADEDPYTFAVQGIGTEPEIGVWGNDVLIVDGDTTPSETDSTDFGTATTDGQYTGRLYIIENTGTASLTLSHSPAVTLTGPHAADFEVTGQPSSTIPAGESSALWMIFRPTAAGLRTATVVIPNDDADENPYTFAVQGTGETVPTVGFISDTLHTAEGAGTATISVTLSAASTETVTVAYRTAQDAFTTASEGPEDADYVHTEGLLTFDPGETVATFGVEIVDDVIHEAHSEWFGLRLDNPQNATGGLTHGSMHIQDDDPMPTVDFSASRYSVDEDDGTAPITVTLQGATALTATVDVRTEEGTATPGVDYGTVERTLVFTPGVMSRVFAVDVVDDGEEEDNETVELAFGRIEEAQAGSRDRAVLTIVGERQTIYLPLAVRGSD